MVTTKDVAIRGRAEVTREYAMVQLRTMWPGAPDDMVIKASYVSARYGLDPMLKEIVLVGFKNRDGGLDWVIVRDIRAKRKMAAKRIAPNRYSYIDDTPRVMTDDEQKKILGEIDAQRIWAITKLKVGSDIYPGYGNWPKGTPAYGSDKGNSQRNMAFIRSEANALDKLAPGDADEDIEVSDTSFVPLEMNATTIEQGKADTQALSDKAIDDAYGPENGN